MSEVAGRHDDHMETTSAHCSVVSTDGTLLAYERFGTGTPLITVCGATADRALMRPTAEAFGRQFLAVAYDRRGRGDSRDTPPYAVEREIEDLAAIIAEVGGGPVHLYGHSSGAGLVLRAVAAGLPVERFVLHEPPYSPDDPAAQEEAREWARHLVDLLGRGERAEAIAEFFRSVGAPEEVVDQVKTSPGLVALAPTLAYDSAVMDDLATGGVIPADLARRVTQPALVLVGGQSPSFMHEVGQRLADLLPAGSLQVLADQEHVADPEVLTPVVVEFLRE
jgi:pimeloyl-ACP methyl ester carboxylesterase